MAEPHHDSDPDFDPDASDSTSSVDDGSGPDDHEIRDQQYSCTNCGKRYKFQSGLIRHLENKACIARK